MDSPDILAAALAAAHPDEAAALLETCEPATAAGFLCTVPTGTGVGVLNEMSSAVAISSLIEMPRESAAALLGATSLSAAAAMLRQMPATPRDALLAAMSRPRRLQVGLLMRQPQLSVGAWMDSSVKPLRRSTRAGDAKAVLKQIPSSTAYLMVIDKDHLYRGRVSVSAVVAADDDVTIGRIFEPDGPTLRATAEVMAALSDTAWSDHDELPVVDRTGKFLGTIRYVDLRQALARSERYALEEIRPPGTSVMDFADLWYLGLARAAEIALGRRNSENSSNRGESK